MRIVITSPLASHDEQLVEKVRQLAAGGPITIFPDPWVEDAERFAQNLSESRLSAQVIQSLELFPSGRLVSLNEAPSILVFNTGSLVGTVILVLGQNQLEEVFYTANRMFVLRIKTFITGRSAYWMDLAEGTCGSL
jgi:hypothetical protein